MKDKAAEFHPALEALRGVAAMMVVWVHCTLCWSDLTSGDASATFVSGLLLIPLNTDAPVELFFVLSGFVLTSALFKLGGTSPRSIGTYAVRRLIRIVPAAWTALFVTLAVFAVCSRWPQYFEGTAYWIEGYLESANFGNLGRSLLFVDDLINPMYWSLQVELVASALMPLIYATLERKRPALGIASVMVLLLLLPFVPYRLGPLGHLSNTFLFCFTFGTLAFHVVASYPRLAERLFSLPVGISAAGLLVLTHNFIGPSSVFGPILGYTESLAEVLGEGPNIDIYGQHLVEAAAAALLVGSVVVNPGRWTPLEHPASRFIGRISYSLYVIHFPIIVAFIVLVRAMLGGFPIAHLWWAPLLAIAVVVPISIAAAALLHFFIERPGITLGGRVARMLASDAGLRQRSLAENGVHSVP